MSLAGGRRRRKIIFAMVGVSSIASGWLDGASLSGGIAGRAAMEDGRMRAWASDGVLEEPQGGSPYGMWP
eukprot:1162134-Pelagomonas_calceolata.AAC.1